jgi:Sel1 repeat
LLSGDTPRQRAACQLTESPGNMRIIAAIGFVAIAAGTAPAFSEDTKNVPLTDCDTYAASDFDAKRKEEGLPFEKVDPHLAIPACESAVRQYPNSPRLIFQLGRAYHKSNDFSLALTQYRRAADQGYAVAQYALGFMYANGHGAPQNYTEALKWYRKAADQGDANAENNIGAIYAKGQGVQLDYGEAAKWYRKAANKGNTIAQSNLAALYDRFPTLRAQTSQPQPSQREAQTGTAIPPPKSDKKTSEPKSTSSSQSSATSQRIDKPMDDLGELERIVRQAQACIRGNIPAAYQSGAYGNQQVTSFFKVRCFGPYSAAFRQLGLSDVVEPGFDLLVMQEVAPEQWQRALEDISKR